MLSFISSKKRMSLDNNKMGGNWMKVYFVSDGTANARQEVFWLGNVVVFFDAGVDNKKRCLFWPLKIRLRIKAAD